LSHARWAALFLATLCACGARTGLDVPPAHDTTSSGAGSSGGASGFQCQIGTPPVALASGLNWPYGVVTDDTFVYFTTYDRDAGAVWRVPKAGGAAEPIAPHLDYPDQLVLVGGALYAAVAGEARIIRVPTRTSWSG
jgi:hypothetical protein